MKFGQKSHQDKSEKVLVFTLKSSIFSLITMKLDGNVCLDDTLDNAEMGRVGSESRTNMRKLL